MILLLACAGAPDGSCDELAPAPLASCFGGDGVAYEGYGTVAVTGEGTVESTSSGPFPAGCDVRAGGDAGGDATVVTVRAASGEHLTFGLATSGVALPLRAGDVVHYDASYTFGEFGPDVAWIVLTRDGGGTVAHLTAGSVAELHPVDGVTLAAGDAVCEIADECGDWARHDLDVTVGGEGATVGYGGSATVGGWHVVHGGVEAQLDGGSTCPDYYVAHAEVVLIGP